MEPAEQLAFLVPAFCDVVVEVRDDQLDSPTPCTDWNVGDLFEHMTSGATAFAAAFRGEEAAAQEDGDPRKNVADALIGFASSLDAPGAFDRTIEGLPFGDMPGKQFAYYVAFDLLMHSWDLATATRRPLRTSEPIVQSVDAWARGWLTDDYRQPGMFAPPTDAPPDATPLERLVAFSGRDLTWAP